MPIQLYSPWTHISWSLESWRMFFSAKIHPIVYQYHYLVRILWKSQIILKPQANIWCVGRTGKKTPYTFSNAPTTPLYYVWAKKLWMVPIPKVIANHAWPINHAKHNVQRNSCLESQQWCYGLWYWYNPANHEQCVALECRMVLRMTK